MFGDFTNYHPTNSAKGSMLSSMAATWGAAYHQAADAGDSRKSSGYIRLVAICNRLFWDDVNASFPPAPKAKRAQAPRLSMPELVKAVRGHANANYNKGGWDYLVECWSDAEIELEIGKARTVAGAIRACKFTVGLLDERRREVMSEAF